MHNVLVLNFCYFKILTYHCLKMVEADFNFSVQNMIGKFRVELIYWLMVLHKTKVFLTID